MATDYAEIAVAAAEIIAEAGSSAYVLRRNVGVAADPDKPWRVTDDAPDDTTMTAVIVADQGKTTIYISPIGLPNVPGDDMLVVAPNGVVWAFVNGSIQSLEPAGDGVSVLYTGSLVLWPT